ncbi:S1C family serine protease [Ideonella sp. A 288]|uniref:S1C family serine protease n=1 Tax=Ideonella sp. A 288 TaxID=1962181 RepID=UPI000B4A7BC3|nr:trypsin-like peptidase domain-containing protein [Ideonella sp. A 288]
MARTPLYSRSPLRPARAAPAGDAVPPGADAAPAAAEPSQPEPAAPPSRWARAVHRRERWLWAAGALLLALLAGWPAWTGKIIRPLSFEQIDTAMRDSIAKEPLNSAAAAAYAAVLPSVVRVVGRQNPPAGTASGTHGKRKTGGKIPADHPKVDADPDEAGRSVGTGVVIVDKGLILTNLHVVQGADRITVTFADGTDSDATIVGIQAQDDLAVLQALVIPDDLHAATMRSTGGLVPGDHVVAVGFPFGIGPSASYGVVSGLKREFRSPEGKRMLSNLIQFDAAANPGNSGGPLVTLDGHVVGIVTAIMNPNQQRTFIGIGFAVPIENAAGAAGLPPF